MFNPICNTPAQPQTQQEQQNFEIKMSGIKTVKPEEAKVKTTSTEQPQETQQEKQRDYLGWILLGGLVLLGFAYNRSK